MCVGGGAWTTKVELFVVLLAVAMTIGIPLPMMLMAWRARRLTDQLRRVSNPPVPERVSLDDRMMAALKRRDGSLVAYAKPDMVRYGGYGVIVLAADGTGVQLFRNALRDPSPIATWPWSDVGGDPPWRAKLWRARCAHRRARSPTWSSGCTDADAECLGQRQAGTHNR